MLEKLTILDFFLRSVPEVLVFTFAAYIFSNIKVNVEKIIKVTFILSISVFMVRRLPISYGVHTIINLIIQTVVIASICKISIVKLIKAGILSTILLLLSEGLTMYIYNIILGMDLTTIFQNDIKRIIYGMPSLVIFSLVIVSYYFYLNRSKKLSDV